MSKEDVKELESQIRSCLVSIKGRCEAYQLARDFKMLMGYGIPYSKFGYRTLEDFLCKIPSLTVVKCNGALYVDAKPSEKSAHISDMVDRQKTSTKKKPQIPRFRTPYIQRYSDSRPTWKANYNQNKPTWKPKNLINAYLGSSRPAAVSHNQFVNKTSSPKKPPAPSRIANRLNIENVPPEEKKQKYKDLPQVPKPVMVPKPVVVPIVNNVSVKSYDDMVNEGDDVVFKTRRRIIQKMSNINEKTVNGEPVMSNNAVSRELVKEFNAKSNGHLVSNNCTNSPVIQDKINGDVINNIKITLDVKTETKLPPFIPTGNCLEDLIRYTRERNLSEPIIKVISRQTKSHKPKFYDCQIKIDKLSFSSYPRDFQDELSAKEFAAKKALDEFLKQKIPTNSLLISDDFDVRDRIPPIVKSHYHGVWDTQLQADYMEKFKEALPLNWIEIIDKLVFIEVVPAMDKNILRYCKPGEAFQKGNSTSTITPLVTNISVPTNSIMFNEDNLLIAEITCVFSAGEIWCRQLETLESQAFSEMISKMEQYYNENAENEIVENAKIGGYYVAFHEAEWCRVRVVETTDQGIHCFCIDFGDEWVVSKSCLFNLKRQFAVEAAQGFVSRLCGLEEFYELSKSCDYLHNLIGKIVQVELDSSTDECGGCTPTDPAISVVLYDMEEQVVINNQLISRISLESAKPILNKNCPTEVYLSHALDEGLAYVQVRSAAYEKLISLLKELEQTIVEYENLPLIDCITSENDAEKLYFFKSSEDVWHRIKINDWSSNKQFAQLLFVDSGKTTIVPTNVTVYPLDKINSVLDKYAHQAVLVRVSIDKTITDFANRLTSLILSNQSAILRISDYGNNDIPIVELFKRSETDNVLFSVNTALSIETEMRNSSLNESNNRHSATLQKLISMNQFNGKANKNVPSSGFLSSPPLPPVGAYFDVIIPHAVNPYNFFVQPYESRSELAKLMSTLQVRYKSAPRSPLQLSDLVPGQIYASQHSDGVWYRTSVIKVIQAGSISVFYCDFGYYSNLSVDQLMPLDTDFLNLPYQALKAKLTGIEPKHSKWAVDDCTYFEKLVCGKAFVSSLVSKEMDDLYHYDTVLNLKLIDTSTTDDVHIDSILVNRGIAKYCEKN